MAHWAKSPIWHKFLVRLAKSWERPSWSLAQGSRRGDSQLGEQLFAAVDQLVQNPAAPQDQRDFGKALLNILVGETSPNLDGLPPELAFMVRGLLARLRN